MTASVLVCGSMAFDTITVFEGHFKDHILADRIQSLSVSFFVPSMRKEFGGCAGNIAYSLKLLGGQPVPVAAIGDDAVDYIERFKTLQIDTSRMRVMPGTFTAQCYITTDLDDNQIASFHPGAMLRSAENDLTGAQAAWAIVAPDSKDGMFAHAERLHAAGIPFIFDLGQAMPLFDGADLERMLKLAQVLTVNDYEAGVVEQRTGRSMQDIAATMQAVVVTRGAAGSTLLTQGTSVDIPGVVAEAVVDPTGCGDSHRAGLLYGLTNGWSWLDSCRLANVVGAIKIASRGPQNHTLDRAVLDEKLRTAYGIGFPA
jgi:adenosine kinase